MKDLIGALDGSDCREHREQARGAARRHFRGPLACAAGANLDLKARAQRIAALGEAHASSQFLTDLTLQRLEMFSTVRGQR
jgi:hypothetical protein